VLTPQHLPALALLAVAVTALVAGALGEVVPARAAGTGRILIRLALLGSVADLVHVVLTLPPGGVLTVTLWRITPSLPVTLQVDDAGLALAIAAATAALVISLATHDGPLASAALGTAALGAMLAGLAGGLLAMYIGLQLSAVGGIGLSYARLPRAPSGRLLAAAVADQAVSLIWLGAVVGLNLTTGTVVFAGIPTAAVSLPLAGVLVIPGVARLTGASFLPDRYGSPRASDLGDLLAVVAVPTGLGVLLRVQELAGGTWPHPALGTALDGVAIILGLGALLLQVREPGGTGLRSLLMVGAALVLLGFGADSASGTALAVVAGVSLELTALLGPRVLVSDQPVATAALPPGLSRVFLLPLGLPVSAAVTAGVAGLALGLNAGLVDGLLPTLGFLVALAGLAVGGSRLLRAPCRPLPWPLVLPGFLLAAAALLPGGLLQAIAAPVTTGGGFGLLVLTAPDPLSVQLPGLLWPGGYLAVVAVVFAGGYWGVREVLGSSAPDRGKLSPSPQPDGWRPPRWEVGLVAAGRARQALTAGLRISAREMAERPVWMWLAASLAVSWLLVQR
jgi:hypothetical protein